MVEKAKLESHYSGELSRAFWVRINNLPEGKHETAYALGAILQSVEERVLRLIESVEDRP